MTTPKNLSMNINESQVNVTKINGQDYISLTDMAKSAGSHRALHSWLRTKNTIDFLGLWEQINNLIFKVHEFVYFKNNAGANSQYTSLLSQEEEQKKLDGGIVKWAIIQQQLWTSRILRL